MSLGDFLRFADGPLAERPPVVNTFEWPPPAELVYFPTFERLVPYEELRPHLGDKGLGHLVLYRRIRHSQISDTDIATMSHVVRGAEYEVAAEEAAVAS